ncbi:MAG: YkoP family protein [Eubacteriales bacterium]
MKIIIKGFFLIMDNIAKKLGKWILIPGTDVGYFYVYQFKYKGKQVTLEDGTIINKGDELVELHLNNKKYKNVSNSVREIFKIFDSEMEKLATAFVEDKRFANVKGIYGRTLLFGVAKKRGFEVSEIESSSMSKFIKIWDSLIKYAYEAKNQKLKFREPKQIWISKEKFIKVNMKI